MAENLTSKSCTPCRGGLPPLAPKEVEGHHRQIPAWDVRDDSHRIERTFRLKTFAEAFAFVQRVADLAEAEGHHPDVCFGWGYATVSLQTKKPEQRDDQQEAERGYAGASAAMTATTMPSFMLPACEERGQRHLEPAPLARRPSSYQRRREAAQSPRSAPIDSRLHISLAYTLIFL